jgi:hypothetical protein
MLQLSKAPELLIGSHGLIQFRSFSGIVKESFQNLQQRLHQNPGHEDGQLERITDGRR